MSVRRLTEMPQRVTLQAVSEAAGLLRVENPTGHCLVGRCRVWGSGDIYARLRIWRACTRWWMWPLISGSLLLVEPPGHMVRTRLES